MSDGRLTEAMRRVAGPGTNARIIRAALAVGVVTAVAKLVAALRDVVVAGTLGAGRDVDAFFLAFALPTFVATVIGGSFASAFVPNYVRVEEHDGAEAAARLLRSMLTIVSITLALAALGLALVGPLLLPLLGASGSGPDPATTRTLLLWLLPTLLFSGWTATLTAALSARERFVPASLAGAANPFISMALLLFAGRRFGVEALAIGTLLGFFVEAVIIAVILSRLGVPVMPRWSGMTEDVRRVLGQYLPVLGGTLVMSSNPVVDQAVAARLGAGSVSALAFGSKPATLISAVGVMALGNVVLPHLSRMVARRDWAALRRTFKIDSIFVIAVAMPVTLVLIFLSRPIVDLVYGHGAFSSEDVRRTAEVQALYAIQLPFAAASIIGVRLLSALDWNRALLVIGALNVVVNLGSDILFARWFGVAGVALSTSIVHVAAFCVISAAAVSRLRAVSGKVLP